MNHEASYVPFPRRNRPLALLPIHSPTSHLQTARSSQKVEKSPVDFLLFLAAPHEYLHDPLHEFVLVLLDEMFTQPRHEEIERKVTSKNVMSQPYFIPSSLLFHALPKIFPSSQQINLLFFPGYIPKNTTHVGFSLLFFKKIENKTALTSVVRLLADMLDDVQSIEKAVTWVVLSRSPSTTSTSNGTPAT